MSFRKWFVRKLFGFSPDHYKEKMETLLDGMAHQIADVIVYKDRLKKDIASMKEALPSDEWHAAVQNAIKALDERTEDMATHISNHEEALEHIFSDDDSITMTHWGLVSNNKRAN